MTEDRPGMQGPHYVVSIVLAMKVGDYTRNHPVPL